MNLNLDAVVNTIPNVVFSQVQGFLTGHLVKYFLFPELNPLAASVAFVVKDLIYEIAIVIFNHFEIKLNNLYFCAITPAAFLGIVRVWSLANAESEKKLIFVNMAISISAVVLTYFKIAF